jgi:hypothetical protein
VKNDDSRVRPWTVVASLKLNTYIIGQMSDSQRVTQESSQEVSKAKKLTREKRMSLIFSPGRVLEWQYFGLRRWDP